MEKRKRVALNLENAYRLHPYILAE